MLDHLDVAAIDVDALSVHTPDLDDVFLALTGRPAEDENDTSTESRRRLHDEHRHLRRPRLQDDAATQPAADGALPVPDLFLVGGPIIFLLLFVYVFGETLGAGLGGPSGDRADYVNYVVPGIVVLTVAAAVQGTAISVAMDMYEGIIARFRTMAISRTAVLTGHVVSSLIQTMGSMAVITGVALLVGFRPNATPWNGWRPSDFWRCSRLALIWLAAALGLNAKSVETASNAPTILVLLPLLGSGFVPTDSMPTALRWFAEYQPFTSVIETVRGLLLGTAVGINGVLAVGWSIGIGLASFLWARHLFNRPPRALSMLATSSARPV